MSSLALDSPGTTKLLMGNEAIARGAIEAGIRVATAYPGTPSTEIIDALSKVAKELDIYVEWSINEKVALEIAVAASFCGLRAISSMKQNGINVAMDFLSNINLTGINAGLVLVICDDPGGISSTNEQDSRHVAKTFDLPLLEPATFQEAADMTKWAFELSEDIANICIVRSVTRISHARGNVVLGELCRAEKQAYFDTSRKPYASICGTTPPQFHKVLHQNLTRIREKYESSPFNWYAGPQTPKLLIITCGSGWYYSSEAVKRLSLEKSVGILKLGTTWPLPLELVRNHLLMNKNILIVEEIDAFLESNIKELSADLNSNMTWSFYGKTSGHINPFGELTPDMVTEALAKVLNMKYISRDENYVRKCKEMTEKYVINRALEFCAGCPHRASFWSIKDALKFDGRDGVLLGDIGCYSMALTPTGFSQLRTVNSMGSGAGLATGLGKLNQFQFRQPVLAVSGDSTFFHAVMPALMNGVHNQSDFILIVLDNSGTAMTGFQPHPGINTDAMGNSALKVDIPNLCRALGIKVIVTDAYDIHGTKDKLIDLLGERGKPRVLISRRECALIGAKVKGRLYKVRVNSEKCVGESCGCDRYCTRIFKCPGLIWDKRLKKAKVDEGICSGCGVCADVCPHSAIEREKT